MCLQIILYTKTNKLMHTTIFFLQCYALPIGPILLVRKVKERE